MLASLALLLTVQAQQPAYELGGVRTPVVIPKWTPDPVAGSTLTQGGWTYHFRNGNLTGRTRTSGGWDELAALSAQATDPAAIKWPMKIFVAGQLDQISKTDMGFWMPRKYVIESEELRGLRSEVALFCYMVRAYTGGKVEIEPDFELDPEVRLLDPEVKADEALLVSLNGRLIGSKGYRSCMAISSELDFQPTTKVVGAVPTTFLPFFATYDFATPGQFARTIFNAWTEQVQDAAALEGYEVSSSPTRLSSLNVGRSVEVLHDPADSIVDSMWADLADAQTPNYDRNRPSLTGPALSWSSVADNPWVKLPYLTAGMLKTLDAEVRPMSEGATIANTAFHFATRGAIAAGKAVWVQDRYVDLFGSKDYKPIGFVAVGGRMLVAFEPKNSELTDAELLGVTPQPKVVPAADTKMSVPFDANEAERLPVAGYFTIRTVVDNDRGAVGEVRQYPRPRSGWVRLLGGGADQPIFDAAKTPYLEFWLKTGTSAAPVDVVAQGPGNQKRFRVFGQVPGLPGYPKLPAPEIAVSSEGSWQKVVIDLRGADKSGSFPVSSLYLAPPVESAYWSPPSPIAPILLDDLKVVETSSEVTPIKPTSNLAPIAEASDPFSRALWAATGEDAEKLRVLLGDKDYVVVTNALMRFGTRKDPLAIPPLISLARSFLLRPGHLAYEALAAQDSDEAWTAISQSLTQGPFDMNKREGARLLVRKSKDAKLAGQMSLLFVSPSWETRRQASMALAQLDGDAAKIVSLSFVNGSEVAIRETAVRAADTRVSQVRERLLVMLDPISESSDYLRALAAVKLLGSGDKKSIDATWKSVPNLSAAALAVFLDELAPAAENRPMVLGLATQWNSISITAALRWLGKAGGVTEADLANFGTTSDPRVFLQLLALRKENRAVIPAAWEQRMRESRDWRVREQLGNQ